MGQDNSRVPRRGVWTDPRRLSILNAQLYPGPLFSGMGSARDTLNLKGSLDEWERKTQTNYLGLSSETRTLAGTDLSVIDNYCHNKPKRGDLRDS